MTGTADSFDADAYWIDRHETLSGDTRNVGNRGLSHAQNVELIAAKATLIAQKLGQYGARTGSRVLDAGCGAGEFSKHFVCCPFKYTGFDVSPRAIEQARQTTNTADFFVASLPALDHAKHYDFVLCLDVLYHLTDKALWQRAVSNLERATAPGGYILIIESFGDDQKTSAHTQWRSKEDYAGAFKTMHLVETVAFRYPYEPHDKTLIIFEKRSA